jgi:hypothetical protein
MRYLLVAASLALSLSACQSSRLVYPTGIYKSAASFRQQRPNTPGTQAGRVLFQRKLFVETAAAGGHDRTKVALDSAWGYAAANGAAYRVYRRQAFRVEQVDSLVLYSHQDYLPDPAYVATATPLHHTTRYYFSNGLTGPVQLLTRKRLKRTFATNLAFVRLLDQRLFHSLTAREQQGSDPNTYRVVALYRQSLAPATR